MWIKVKGNVVQKLYKKCNEKQYYSNFSQLQSMMKNTTIGAHQVGLWSSLVTMQNNPNNLLSFLFLNFCKAMTIFGVIYTYASTQ